MYLSMAIRGFYEKKGIITFATMVRSETKHLVDKANSS